MDNDFDPKAMIASESKEYPSTMPGTAHDEYDMTRIGKQQELLVRISPRRIIGVAEESKSSHVAAQFPIHIGSCIHDCHPIHLGDCFIVRLKGVLLVSELES